MVEFCKDCGGMMLPSKDKNRSILKCNSCGHIKPIKQQVIQSYKFNTEIHHPPGEEFKNLKKMKDWKKKKLINKNIDNE
jgi:DNA-directed RNA polymerase subunit M/transcription elongation factor TFIIS